MIEAPQRLSYSSLSTYAECGERWRLERGYGLDNSTWFATVAGSAVHNITEILDLIEFDGVVRDVPTFKDEFDRLLAREAENGVEVKASGRKLVNIGANGGPNKKDYEWWLIYGPPMIDRWQEWKQQNGYALAIMPDGTPGIEIRIEVPIGDEPQLGFIDRVYIDDEGHYVIVDLKTGAVPKSKLQLGTYRVGLYRKYGILADQGTYWMASDGELTPITNLRTYSPEYMDWLFAMSWRGIRAGVFLPNVTSMCNGCSVKDFCRAVGGQGAVSIPINEVVTSPTPVSAAA